VLTTAVIAKITADGVGREDVPVNDGVINANTTKHDRARLLHIFVEPRLIETWSLAHQVMDRATLDDKDGRIDHW